MQIIPALDFAGGSAVHARGGERNRYTPVDSVLLPGRSAGPAGALALAAAFRHVLGAEVCYAADLDAIQGGEVQTSLLRALTGDEGFGRGMMVDAGIGDPARAAQVLASGAARAVVGLETLPYFADLGAIVKSAGADRVVFSLDLRLGRPFTRAVPSGSGAGVATVPDLAARAAAEGVTCVLLLDLGRVGTDLGIDLPLLAMVRRELPGVQLLAGGGVQTRADLERMADTGCDGAVIASAIHAGRIAAADVAAVQRPRGQHAQSETRNSR